MPDFVGRLETRDGRPIAREIRGHYEDSGPRRYINHAPRRLLGWLEILVYGPESCIMPHGGQVQLVFAVGPESFMTVPASITGESVSRDRLHRMEFVASQLSFSQAPEDEAPTPEETNPAVALKELRFPVATDPMRDVGFDAEADWVLKILEREKARLEYIRSRDERIIRDAMYDATPHCPPALYDRLRGLLAEWLEDHRPSIVGLRVRYDFSAYVASGRVSLVMSVDVGSTPYSAGVNFWPTPPIPYGSPIEAFRECYAILIHQFGRWERAPRWDQRC